MTACRNPASAESDLFAPRPPLGATLCRGDAPPLPSYRDFGDRKGPS